MEQKIKKETILVVDDEPEIMDLLKRALQLEGYSIMEADRGRKALEIIEDEMPDIVVLDINLPDIDGYTVCKEIRKRASSVPIIMLTAATETVHRIKGLDSGADDYLGKPFNVRELVARIKIQLRHKEEARIRAEEILRSKWEDINEGLHLIQKFQQPYDFVTRIPDIDVAIHYFPIGKIGGDFYHIHPLDDNRVAVLIGDAVGKGLIASFLMASTFSLIHKFLKIYDSPRQIFAKVNELLRAEVGNLDVFVAAFLGIWDRRKRSFTYCNAAHQPPVQIKKEFNRHVFLNGNGFFLGAFDDGKYGEAIIPIEKGDRIFFYTDGLSDLRNKAGKTLDLRNMYRLILKNKTRPVKDIAEMLLKRFQEFARTELVMKDDLTFFIVEFQ